MPRNPWTRTAISIPQSSARRVIELQRTLYEELGLGDLTLRINSIGTAETRHRYVEALRAHLEPHVATLSRDSQRRFEIRDQRIDIGAFGNRPARLMRVEVAVRALAHAPRKVDVGR